jgi:lipopolysaccharide/colanic/teichoic acid biosynthesis glycosyltransferase
VFAEEASEEGARPFGAETSMLIEAAPLGGSVAPAYDLTIEASALIPSRLASVCRDLVAAVGRWQEAARQPFSIAADTVVVMAVLWAVIHSTPQVLAAAAAFAAGGCVFGLWRPRSTIESQGFLWYGKAAIAPLLASLVVLRTSGAHIGQLIGGSRQALAAVALALAVLVGVHVALWLAAACYRQRSVPSRRALLIGGAECTQRLALRLAAYPELGLAPVAAYNPAANPIGTGAELVDRLIAAHRPDHVLCIADSSSPGDSVFKDFVAFARGRVELSLVQPAGRMTRSGSRIGDHAVFAVRSRPAWGSAAAKRIFDIVAASVLVILVSPVLALTTLAIRLEDGGPVLYRQRRTGMAGKSFSIYKFRSMTTEASSAPDEYLSKAAVGELTFKVVNDPRVTRVGRLIRRFAVDELPQLFNVIKGDMSLVGPRPLAFAIEQFDGRGKARHRIRPGITGLWQVSGANALDDTDMFDLDLSYISNRSLGLDLMLLARTLPAVVVRRAPA